MLWKRLNLSGFSSFFFFKKTRACVSRVTSLSQGVQRKNPKKGPAQLTPPESLILSRQLTKANFFLDRKTNPKKKTPINHPTGDATCCKPGDFLVTTGTPHFRRIGSAFFTKAELNRNGRQPRLTDWKTVLEKRIFPNQHQYHRSSQWRRVFRGGAHAYLGENISSRLRPTVGKPGDNKPGEREREVYGSVSVG